MAAIQSVERKGPGGLQKALGLGQIGVGIATGNPLLAGTGVAALSSSDKAKKLAGIANSVNSLSKSGDNKDNAIQRRQDSQRMSIDDRVAALKDAESFIPELPRDVQEDVAIPIFTSLALSVPEYKQAKGIR